MKRFLFNLLICFSTFLFGISVQNIINLKQKVVTNLSLKEQQNIQIPVDLSIEKQLTFERAEATEFDSAWYLDDYGFKGMREVWTILLSKDYKDSNNEEVVWSAHILTDNENNNFESIWIKTDNNELSFKTKKVKGIQYKFKGVFFKGKKQGEDDEKVLRGSLQKFVKGKKVATVKADFAYKQPRCWH